MARKRSARPEARPIRLFVAVETPEEGKRAVARALGGWRDRFPKARWVPEENWHVTVKFVGWTYPRLLDWVRERVSTAAAGSAPFETRLTELGAFPSPRRARVLWAGLDDRAGAMAELALAMDASMAKEFKPEVRAFRPHLTVARSDPPLVMPDGFAGTAIEPVAFRVDHVTMFRSHLQRPAPRYEPLATFPLGD